MPKEVESRDEHVSCAALDQGSVTPLSDEGQEGEEERAYVYGGK